MWLLASWESVRSFAYPFQFDLGCLPHAGTFKLLIDFLINRPSYLLLLFTSIYFSQEVSDLLW